MTAKKQLEQTVAGLTEAEAADALQLLERQRPIDEGAATALLDSIPGALDSARHGLDDARANRTIALNELRRRADR